MLREPLVFISYARKQSEYSERIDRDLKKEGYQTWRDIRDLNPSQDFSGEIEQAIRKASHMVVCLSEDVTRPDSFVKREVAYALARDEERHKLNPEDGLPIIPVLFPQGEMPLLISTWTYIPCTEESQYQNAIENILKRLRSPEVKNESPRYSDSQELVEYLNNLHVWASEMLSQSVYVLLTPRAEKIKFDIKNLFKFDVSPVLSDNPGVSQKVHPPQIKGERVYDSFLEAFVNCNRRVLLIGEPGAGKTTTLLAMARDAAVARLNDPKSPIPVPARIHTWDFETPIPEWARSELGIRFIHQITGERLMYILDGLDELIPPKGNPETDPVKTFLDRVAKEFSKDDLVVSCRKDNYLKSYTDKESPLQPVKLCDLSDEQIEDFFRVRRQEELFNAMKVDPQLMDLGRTPLLLTILSYSFDRDNIELEDLKSLNVAKLFDRYVQRRFIHEQARVDSLDYSESDTRERLGRLAVNMRKEQFLIASETREKFNALFEGEGDRFLSFAKRMHFLQEDQNRSVQFVHLYLQAFFATPKLIQLFQNKRTPDREQIRILLLRLGRIAIPELLANINHKSPDIRLLVIESLGKTGDPSYFDELADRALKDHNSMVREFAIHGFVEIANQRSKEVLSKKVVDVIAQCLKDRSLDVRLTAAKTLGYFRSREAVPALLEVLQKGDIGSVLSEVANALGKIGEPEAVPHLIELLRYRAIYNLWRIPIHHLMILLIYRLVSRHLRYFEDRKLPGITSSVRESAITALGEIGQKDVVGALLEYLNDKNTNVRMATATALGNIGDAVAVPPLLNLLKDVDLRVRSKTALALGKIGDYSAIKPLLEILADPANLEENNKEHWMQDNSKDVYSHVLSALSSIGAERVLKSENLEVLLQTLNDDRELIRIDAAETLGILAKQIRVNNEVLDSSVVPVLEKALDDPSSYVRHHAAIALKRISTPRALSILKSRNIDVSLYL